MPKTPEQCGQMREDMKAYIMNESLGYFAKKGLAGTKISQLSKAIGIGQGTLYSYFASKEELFQSIIDRAVRENSDSLKTLWQMPLSPKQKIIALSQQMIKSIYEEEGIAEMFVLNMHVKLEYGETNEITKGYRELPQFILSNIIEEGQKDESFVEGSPAMLADFYWTVVHGISINKICDNASIYRPTEAQLIRILIKDDRTIQNKQST